MFHWNFLIGIDISGVEGHSHYTQGSCHRKIWYIIRLKNWRIIFCPTETTVTLNGVEIGNLEIQYLFGLGINIQLLQV